MLFAKSELRYGPSLIRLHMALARRLEIQTTERRASTFDTRLLPRRTGEGRERLILHVYLAGKIRIHGLSALEVPFVALSTEAQYYGSSDERPVPLQASGDPYLKIEVRVPASDALVTVPRTFCLLEPPTSFFEAARTYVDTVGWESSDAATRDKAARTFLMHMVRAGWLGAATFGGAVDIEAPALTRLWDAIVPSLAVVDLNATLGLFSRRSGITSRHVARNVDALLKRIDSPLGYRAFIAEHRLKVALILMSAPHAKLDEVATLCGYASGESLAAAMRDAGIPAPGQIRKVLDEPI